MQFSLKKEYRDYKYRWCLIKKKSADSDFNKKFPTISRCSGCCMLCENCESPTKKEDAYCKIYQVRPLPLCQNDPRSCLWLTTPQSWLMWQLGDNYDTHQEILEGNQKRSEKYFLKWLKKNNKK